MVTECVERIDRECAPFSRTTTTTTSGRPAGTVLLSHAFAFRTECVSYIKWSVMYVARAHFTVPSSRHAFMRRACGGSRIVFLRLRENLRTCRFLLRRMLPGRRFRDILHIHQPTANARNKCSLRGALRERVSTIPARV